MIAHWAPVTPLSSENPSYQYYTIQAGDERMSLWRCYVGQKKIPSGAFLMVQWLRLCPSNAGGVSSILGQELRSHMPNSMALKRGKHLYIAGNYGEAHGLISPPFLNTHTHTHTHTHTQFLSSSAVPYSSV